tara:strand:- start:483 stop:671 length:189 start_codon:yes stop_codon:yes gene_type:complete
VEKAAIKHPTIAIPAGILILEMLTPVSSKGTMPSKPRQMYPDPKRIKVIPNFSKSILLIYRL